MNKSMDKVQKRFPLAVVVGLFLGSVFGGFLLWGNGYFSINATYAIVPVATFLISAALCIKAWKRGRNAAANNSGDANGDSG